MRVSSVVAVYRRLTVLRLTVPRIAIVMEPMVAAASTHHQEGERQGQKGNSL
jgi:hypothetical protein